MRLPPITEEEKENIEVPEYLHRLDTSKPGLFIAKLKTNIPHEQACHIQEYFGKKICEYAPGSSVIILTCDFEPVVMPCDETMNSLGWIRKDSD